MSRRFTSDVDGYVPSGKVVIAIEGLSLGIALLAIVLGYG